MPFVIQGAFLYKYEKMQKAQPTRPRFLQQEKEERKNEKEGKNLIYMNARSESGRM